MMDLKVLKGAILYVDLSTIIDTDKKAFFRAFLPLYKSLFGTKIYVFKSQIDEYFNQLNYILKSCLNESLFEIIHLENQSFYEHIKQKNTENTYILTNDKIIISMNNQHRNNHNIQIIQEDNLNVLSGVEVKSKIISRTIHNIQKEEFIKKEKTTFNHVLPCMIFYENTSVVDNSSVKEINETIQALLQSFSYDRFHFSVQSLSDLGLMSNKSFHESSFIPITKSTQKFLDFNEIIRDIMDELANQIKSYKRNNQTYYTPWIIIFYNQPLQENTANTFNKLKKLLQDKKIMILSIMHKNYSFSLYDKDMISTNRLFRYKGNRSFGLQAFFKNHFQIRLEKDLDEKMSFDYDQLKQTFEVIESL